MARTKDREKALFLRKQEKSYSQIKKILGVSKSTLSLWLRDYPLSRKRISELRDRNEQRIEKFRETWRKKREKRLFEVYQKQKKLLLPLTKRELFIAGLFLYWGEGAKNYHTVLVANTDPAVIKFTLFWFTKMLGFPKNKIRAYLHLYSDMNIIEETKYWSGLLKLPLKNFNKPYIKENKKTRINHKGGFGHGTCTIKFGSVKKREEISMGIKAISDYYGKFIK